MSEKRKSDASRQNDSNKSHKSNDSEVTKKRFISIRKAALWVQQNEIKKLKEIIDKGRILNINQPIALYTSRTLLAFACEMGSLDCVRLLVENNAEINNNDDNTLR